MSLLYANFLACSLLGVFCGVAARRPIHRYALDGIVVARIAISLGVATFAAVIILPGETQPIVAAISSSTADEESEMFDRTRPWRAFFPNNSPFSSSDENPLQGQLAANHQSIAF